LETRIFARIAAMMLFHVFANWSMSQNRNALHVVEWVTCGDRNAHTAMVQAGVGTCDEAQPSFRLGVYRLDVAAVFDWFDNLRFSEISG
jgi:hypothetical protein